MHAKLLQSYPTLWEPMDCSPTGSSVHGILQARILEWVAVPSYRGSSPPRDQTCVSYVSCIGRQILYLPVLLSSFRGSGLPSDLTSSTDPRRVIDFSVSLVFYLLGWSGDFQAPYMLD